MTVNAGGDHAHTIPADGSHQDAITAVGDHQHSVAVNLGGQDAAHPNIPPAPSPSSSSKPDLPEISPMGVLSWALDRFANATADPTIPAQDGASQRSFMDVVRGVMAGSRAFADD